MVKKKSPVRSAKRASPEEEKKVLLRIERGVVREAQKEQGALDGRFRGKVVPTKKRYSRKTKKGPEDPEA